MPQITASEMLQILNRLRGARVIAQGPYSWLVLFSGHQIVVQAPPHAPYIVAFRNLANLGPTPSAELLRTLLTLGATSRCAKVCLPPRRPELPGEALGVVGVMGELWNGPQDAPIAMPSGEAIVHRFIQEVARLSGVATLEIQRAAGRASKPQWHG